MTLSFREAATDDLDRLVDIHLSAFPDARGVEPRRRNFAHSPLGELRDLIVAERHGTIVGHAFLFPLEAWFGGVLVKIGGIASLGVAPEARGAGVARALMAELHGRALRRGDALTLLYAFRHAFYSREGYLSVSSYRRFALAPQAIPGTWRDATPGIVRPLLGSDRDAIVRVHEEEGSARTGWIRRPAALWDRKLLNERSHGFVLEQEGRVSGYVAWTLEQAEPHAAVALSIDDLAAEDDLSRRRLLHLAAQQRDQVAEIRIDLADDDPLPRAFVDPDRHRSGNWAVEHALAAVVGGPMVRILDVRRAIEARGYRADGDIDLALQGEAAVRVEVRGGRARVLPARQGPRIALDRPTLGAILYGSLAPSAGGRVGWITADDPATLRLADSLFGLPAYFSVDPF